MPNCSKCNKTQSRLKNDCNLCSVCFNDANKGQVKRKTSNEPIIPSSNENPTNLLENLKIDPKQKASDITIEQQLNLFQLMLKPIENKIADLSENFENKITSLEKRIELLEKEDQIKDEKITVLTTIVTNMQRALNSIDSKDRQNNLIVSGLTENVMELNDGNLLTDDSEKINYLLNRLGIEKEIHGFTTLRIGKETIQKRRMLKLIVKDNKSREVIMKNSFKLKDCEEPFSKVFINRDNHPVYQKEHMRLRKKFRELKET